MKTEAIFWLIQYVYDMCILVGIYSIYRKGES